IAGKFFCYFKVLFYNALLQEPLISLIGAEGDSEFVKKLCLGLFYKVGYIFRKAIQYRFAVKKGNRALRTAGTVFLHKLVYRYYLRNGCSEQHQCLYVLFPV